MTPSNITQLRSRIALRGRIQPKPVMAFKVISFDRKTRYRMRAERATHMFLIYLIFCGVAVPAGVATLVWRLVNKS